MKFVMISDLHLLWDKPIARLDDIRETQRRKLEFVLSFAKDKDAILLEAGDFFNRPRSWYLLPETIDLLKKYKVEILAVFGQHDVYMYNEISRAATSLGLLEKAGLVKILHFGDAERNIYGCSYGQEIPKVIAKDALNILVIHAPIAEQAIYPGQNYMDAFIFLKRHKDFDIILAGDIHQKFIFEYEGRWILNSGAMLRKEANLYNFTYKPGFWFVDAAKKIKPEWIEIPHEPAENVLSRAHLDYSEDATKILDEFINSVGQVEVEDDVSFVDNLWLFVKKNKISKEVENILSEVVNG